MECNKDAKKNIQTRLRKIEGQVKGIEKMLDQEDCCRNILIQVAAVRAAINKVGTLIIENYAKECIFKDNDTSITEVQIDELVKILSMFMK